MTITNGYATLANFKTRYGTQGTDSTRDAEIEAVIQAVSRLIDNYTGRSFFSSASDESRYFTASDGNNIFPDDITSITTLKTDDNADGTYETTWALTDYRTQPINRTANYTPITWITTRINGNHSFPRQVGGIEITGKFGYCTLTNVPEPIKEACYLQSFRLWTRQKAPFGVVGSAEMGQLMAITKFDPDVELLLQPYRRVI